MVPDHLNVNRAINPQTAGLSLRPHQARLDPKLETPSAWMLQKFMKLTNLCKTMAASLQEEREQRKNSQTLANVT